MKWRNFRKRVRWRWETTIIAGKEESSLQSFWMLRFERRRTALLLWVRKWSFIIGRRKFKGQTCFDSMSCQSMEFEVHMRTMEANLIQRRERTSLIKCQLVHLSRKCWMITYTIILATRRNTQWTHYHMT